MTFKEKFDIPRNIDHDTHFDMIIDGLGYENVKKFIPVGKNRIIEALKTDPHLNNISITTWDRATGFGEPHGLRDLCRDEGIDCYSQADLVCILKRCAVRWANEDTKNKTLMSNSEFPTALKIEIVDKGNDLYGFHMTGENVSDMNEEHLTLKQVEICMTVIWKLLDETLKPRDNP